MRKQRLCSKKGKQDKTKRKLHTRNKRKERKKQRRGGNQKKSTQENFVCEPEAENFCVSANTKMTKNTHENQNAKEKNKEEGETQEINSGKQKKTNEKNRAHH